MHPRIAAKVEERFRQLAAQGVKVAVLEAAVLIEAKWSYLVDELWVTLVDEAVAVRRVMARNGLPEDAVRSRIRAQISNADRARQAAVVIDNNGDVDQLRRRVQELWHKRIQPRIGEHVHS
jgi:dephospho-CoA kinase